MFCAAFAASSCMTANDVANEDAVSPPLRNVDPRVVLLNVDPFGRRCGSTNVCDAGCWPETTALVPLLGTLFGMLDAKADTHLNAVLPNIVGKNSDADATDRANFMVHRS
mmetsp:Transcript_35247/g.52418  ORF Transcript_35247/g.52418 Transcript_35247/m.52418 type:complete len:110 (-) Transcript_35247:25-354(-)